MSFTLVSTTFVVALLSLAIATEQSTAAAPATLPLNANCAPAGSVCNPGLACAGTAEKMKCVYTMKEGKRCNIDPYWVCAPDLDCVDNICRRPSFVPLGGSCADPSEKCDPKLQCAGPGDARICVKSVAPGGQCGHEPFWVCENGLECMDNMCRIPKGADCSSAETSCVSGTLCVGEPGMKKCVMPVTEGKDCSDATTTTCATGLKCNGSVCTKPTVPLGGSCMSTDVMCAENLQCAGPTDARVCVKNVVAGGQCEHEPFWVCANELECVDNICRIPKGGECTSAESACIEGTSCVGDSELKRCVMTVNEGDDCTDSMTSICADGLQCNGSVCIKPTIPLGGTCTGTDAMCAAGLECDAPGGSGKCVKTVPMGGKCDADAFMTCQSGLSCEDGVCKIVNEGDCTPEGSICVSGNVCVGLKDRKRCKIPMAEGEPCKTDPYWVCEAGVKCVSNVCRRPLPKEADCTPTGSICEDGLACVGPADRLRCKMPMTEGQACKTDPYWVCADGLNCIDNVCHGGTQIVKVGQLCARTGLQCEAGSVCAGHSKWKRCVTPRPAGEYCRDGSRYVCAEGLQCLSSRCTKLQTAGKYCRNGSRFVCAEGLSCVWKRCRTIVSEGADCKSSNVSCGDGTVCAGKWWKRRCVRPRSEGEKCGADAYQICSKGLGCKSGTCAAM